MQQPEIQPQLYIYTRKAFTINNVLQNFDLIPKLFCSEHISKLMYQPTYKIGRDMLNLELENIIALFTDRYPEKELNKVNIYYFLLTEYDLYDISIKKINLHYLQPIYWHVIMDTLNNLVNDGYLDNSPNNIPSIHSFIEHLFRGHVFSGNAMEYGLYFSFKFAFDDNDFYRYAQREYASNSEIIYFMRFDSFLQYVERVKNHYVDTFREDGLEFQAPLLYVNGGWDAGMIGNYTLVLGENGENINDFNQKIMDRINSETYAYYAEYEKFNIQDAEIVYQLPLPIQIFQSFQILNNQQIPFGPDYSRLRLQGGYYDKYKKYKQKYMQLKNKLTLEAKSIN